MYRFLTEAADPVYPYQDWNKLGSTVLTGLAVVFIALILLIAAFYLFGLLFAEKKTEKKPKQAEKTPQSISKTPESPEPALTEEITESADAEDSPETVIAVISAAIAAYGESEGKSYRIKSVKPARAARSPWNAAGITENMRGF